MAYAFLKNSSPLPIQTIHTLSPDRSGANIILLPLSKAVMHAQGALPSDEENEVRILALLFEKASSEIFGKTSRGCIDGAVQSGRFYQQCLMETATAEERLGACDQLALSVERELKADADRANKKTKFLGGHGVVEVAWRRNGLIVALWEPLNLPSSVPLGFRAKLRKKFIAMLSKGASLRL